MCLDVHTLTSVRKSTIEMREEYGVGLEKSCCRIEDVGVLFPKDLFSL